MGRKKKDDFSKSRVYQFIQETGDILNLTDSNRDRKWFLCINQNAKCFNHLEEKIAEYGEKGSGYFHYAYILHDKDTISEKAYLEMLDKATKADSDDIFIDRAQGYIELPRSIEDSEKTGLPMATAQAYAYKPKHYHLLMVFENARTWSSIRNQFEGANVQYCKSIVNSFKYLTHDTKACIDRGKVKYNVEDIVFSSRGMEFFNNQQGEEVNFDYFDPHKIAKYVWIDNMSSYHEFLLRFGAPQTQRWISSINTECNEKREIIRLARDNKPDFIDEKFIYSCSDGLFFISDEEIENDVKSIVYSVKDAIELKDRIKNYNLSIFGVNYYTVCLYYRVPLNPIEQYCVCKAMPYYAKKFSVVEPDFRIESVKDVPFVFSDQFEVVSA